MAGWYRKQDIRVYGDAKFAELSAPGPNGQTCFQYLYLGPHTDLPGLSVAGEAGLAEALGWPLEAFREAFREASDKGMVKADWKRRVVFVPNVIRYQSPESPNVVVGWAKPYDLIPECELKREWLLRLKSFLDSEMQTSEKGRRAFGEAFQQAFGEAYREALADPSPHPSPNSQSQSQSQIRTCSAPAEAEPAAVKPLPEQAIRLARLLADLMRQNDPKARIPRSLRKWEEDLDRLNRIDGRSWQEIERIIRWCQASEFWRSNVLSAGSLRRQFPRLLLDSKRGGKQAGQQDEDEIRKKRLAEKRRSIRTLLEAGAEVDAQIEGAPAWMQPELREYVEALQLQQRGA